MINFEKHSLKVLLIIVAITLFFSYQLSTGLTFNFDMRNFYPLNNPETKFFEQYTKKFGWDDDYVLIGIESKSKDAFDPSFLKSVDELGKKVRNHPSVTQVISPTEQEIYRYVPFMNTVVNSPLIHMDDKEQLLIDKERVYSRKELIGNLFSADKKSLAIAVRQKPGMQYENCDSLVRDLESMVTPYTEFKKVHFAGKCFGQTTFVNLTKTEILLFVILSILVNIIFLYLTYRSFWGVWMPLMVVGTTVVWTLGTMVFFGLSLDFISNIIPTIILIIGISNIIHLLTHFLSKQSDGYTKIDALNSSIKKIGTATIFTSLTTIIGFLSLLFSNVRPLINLGGYASLGLVYAFILSYTLFPAVVMLYKPGFKQKESSANDIIQSWLSPLFDFVMKQKKAIMITTVILFVFGIWGSMKLVVNQHLLEDISERHPQIQASRFFEKDFSGARQFEMQIALKDPSRSFKDLEVLKDVEKIEKHLLKQYGVGSMFSPVAMYKEANRVLHSGQNSYYKLPETSSEFKKAKDLVKRFMEKQYPKVVIEEEKIARFSGKMPDLGSHLINIKNDSLQIFLKKSGLDKKFTCHVTGSAHLMELNNFNIANNVYYGLWFSCLIIALIIGFMFKSVKMAIIGTIPNVLPLLFVGALMGITGVNIKISTSILFILSFGIAVDDTIHYMSSFRLDRKKFPNDLVGALRQTFLTSGKSIIVTSLILSAGFFTLVFSSFGGTYHIGLFTSICLVVALLADLMLLPVLIYYFGKDFVSTDSKEEQSK